MKLNSVNGVSELKNVGDMVVLDRPNDFLTNMIRIVNMGDSFLASFGVGDDNGNFERSSDIEFDYILHTGNWEDIDELIGLILDDTIPSNVEEVDEVNIDELIDLVLNDAIPCSVEQVDEVSFE